LVADALVKASSTHALLLVEQGAQGTRRNTYSTYWSSALEETLGRIVMTGDLLIEENLVGFSPILAPTGLLSEGIRSMKFCTKSCKQPTTTR
jgi:hypothetical protein